MYKETTMNTEEHEPINHQKFEDAIREALLSKPTKKASYENRRLTKQE